MPHIHVHLHNGKVTQDAEDAGTSEGAKKAALTRKQHGGSREGAARLKSDPRVVEIRHPRTGHVLRTSYKRKRVPVKHPLTGHIIKE
jgi:hypothetical protein